MTGKKKARSAILAVLVLLLLLAAGRIYLPYWLTGYVNRQIDALDGYGGHVRDIDVHLWRGAYRIHGINIFKEQGGLKEPFFATKAVDLSLEWEALIHGAFVAEIDIFDAHLNFAKSQTGEGANWPRLVDTLSPLEINRLELHGGKVAYIDYGASPDVNIYIHQIDAQIKNLRQVTEKGSSLPSSIAISGTSIGGGKMAIGGRMNILQDVPDFDLDIKLENASLAAFNDYAHALAGIDFESGTLSIYTELAAAQGKVTGYIKPIATKVSVKNSGSNPFNALWQSLIAVFMEIFKNHPRDQFAMRVPIEGDLNDLEGDRWSAFVSIFKNAFGRAFIRDTDGNITFNDALLEN